MGKIIKMSKAGNVSNMEFLIHITKLWEKKKAFPCFIDFKALNIIGIALCNSFM